MSESRLQTTSYVEPVSLLLTLGEEWARGPQWPDYLSHGLDAGHVPELIRMATDPALNDDGIWPAPEVWAPVHAWRALGQLGAAQALGPLLELLDKRAREDDDWVMEELPCVFTMMGPQVLDALVAFLDDGDRNMWARTGVARAMARIAVDHPAARARCIEAVARQLQTAPHNDETFNGLMVADLLEMKAVEAAGLIEQAFAEECVDEFVAGNWPLVRYELGLGPEPAPQSMFQALVERYLAAGRGEAGESSSQKEASPPPPRSPLRQTSVPKPHTETRQQRDQRKAKRKQARKARRRNRR
jgi:hypothetical protein